MFRLAVTGTILAAIFIVGVGLLNRAIASETEFNAVLDVQIATAQHFDSGDLEAYFDGLDELYAISLDEATSPECRVFAEAGIVYFTLVYNAIMYPVPVLIDQAYIYIENVLPETGYDCQQAF